MHAGSDPIGCGIGSYSRAGAGSDPAVGWDRIRYGSGIGSWLSLATSGSEWDRILEAACNSFYDLHSFFDSFDRVNNIIKIVHDELIYYAIYSIYCSYRVLIQKYIDDPYDACAYASGTGYFIDIMTTYHKHIRTCIAMLPHHMRAIDHHEAFIHHADEHHRMTVR